MKEFIFEAKDSTGDHVSVVHDGVGPMIILSGSYMDGAVRFIPEDHQVPSLCSAIYTAAGLSFPTVTPDLTAFQTALATLAEKHSSDQSIEMACIALFEEARKVGLLQPEADALDSVRTSLRDISNDPGLSVSERDKAKRALAAMENV